MIPIKVENLTFEFNNNPILKGIGVKFQKSKFYTIIGPNGSGKTTFLKLISNIFPVKKNCVYINGAEINTIKSKDLAKQVAYVPQNYNIGFDFSAMDIVLMGRIPYLKRFEQETSYDLEIVEDAMRKVNVWGMRDKKFNQLSGGEKQRVILARAFAQKSNILLLDEPSSQLDIHHQIDILDTVSEVVKKEGLTVIAVLHDINLASNYSDYIILLKNGNIEAFGTPEEVLNRKMLEEAYEVKIDIVKNPFSNRPHVLRVKRKKEA